MSGYATSEMGQNRKSSMRANVFRFAPESGHRAMQSACPFRARNGSEATRAYGSASRGDNLFDPCQPRILFRADPVVASKRWRPLDLENTALSPPFFD